MARVVLRSAETEPLLTNFEGNLEFHNIAFVYLSLIYIDRHSFDTQLNVVEERKNLEQSLLRKLDRRMSILVLIYILNCTCLVLLVRD